MFWRTRIPVSGKSGTRQKRLCKRRPENLSSGAFSKEVAMKIHEYQAKEVLARFGVAVPEGRLALTAEEAAAAFAELGAPVCAIKAQIHAGGRGKGGGIKLAKTADEARNYTAAMLGMSLVTHQTGPEGKVVQRVWVEKGSAIARELYVAITVDRAQGKPVMMASQEGGMDIEEVAANTPEKIFKETIEPGLGMQGYQARKLAFHLGLTGKGFKAGVKFMIALARAFGELDCSLAEINPLVVTEDGDVVALDAKINFDDNALFRHRDIEELRDLTEEDEKETEAAKHELNYIALDGTIGCMVNGAGLAMASMDIIKLHGGEPANFLDVGGGATKEQVATAFRIILKDPAVKGILVNIFGGILRCTTLAEGIVAAAKEIAISVPLVVRLEGTEVADGRKILEESDVAIITATDMTDAANKIVEAAGAAS